MARRKLVVSGGGGPGWLDELLGYSDRQGWVEVLNDIEPKLDFGAVSRRAGHKLSEIHQELIQNSVTVFFRHWVYWIWAADPMNEGMFGFAGQESLARSKFNQLVNRIEKSAMELSNALDEIGELDRALLMQPHDTNTETPIQLRGFIDKRTGAGPRVHEVSEDDFMEYLSLRRYLSYYRNFRSQNLPFNNFYSQRYFERLDYRDPDRLVRWIIVDLDNSGFPMGVSVPTDTNPDYESPLVAVLLEVHEQLTDMFAEAVQLELLPWRTYNHRQMCYLAAQIQKDLKEVSEAFASVGR